MLGAHQNIKLGYHLVLRDILWEVPKENVKSLGAGRCVRKLISFGNRDMLAQAFHQFRCIIDVTKQFKNDVSQETKEKLVTPPPGKSVFCIGLHL